MRWRRTLLVVALVAGAIGGAAGSAGAGTAQPETTSLAHSGGTWSRAIGVASGLNAGGDATISAVSCASPGNCAAVGYYTPAAASVGQETWNEEPFVADERGGIWQPARTVPGIGPLLAAVKESEGAPLNAVYCTSPGNCMAGGGVGSGHAYVVREHNWVWGKAQLVIRQGGASAIESISCAPSGACAAVGWIYPKVSNGLMAGLAVSESDGTWSAHEVPIPVGLPAPYMSLSSVSCAAAGGCTAVGKVMSEVNGGSPNESDAILVSETKGTWGAARPVPGVAAVAVAADPNKLGFAQMTGISCPVAGDCTAVGTYAVKAATDSFVATEADGDWRPAVQLLSPAGRAASALSCSSVGHCAITGTGPAAFVADESGGSLGLAAEVPGLAALDTGGPLAGDVLSGAPVISCAASGYCAVGGQYSGADGGGGRVFVAAGSAAGWQAAQPVRGLPVLPRDASDAVITSVSCSAAGYCTAGGSYEDSAGDSQAFVVNEATASAVVLHTTKATVGYGHETSLHLTLGVSSPLGGTPAGQVAVKAGQTAVCTVILHTGKGSCTLTAKQLKAGRYALTATYAGSATYLMSVSAAVTVAVTG